MTTKPSSTDPRPSAQERRHKSTELRLNSGNTSKQLQAEPDRFKIQNVGNHLDEQSKTESIITPPTETF
eukprot:3052891-Pyramimonas_sp.AAC.1